MTAVLLRNLLAAVALVAALLPLPCLAGPKIITYLPSDFNGDGHADILWHNEVSGDVYRMLMWGPAIQDGALVYSEPDTAWKIVGTGDFNADGKTDVLWRNESTGYVYMMLFDWSGEPGGGFFVYHEPDPDWKIVAVADLDGDVFADILWWHAGTGRVYALLMRGILVEREGEVYQEPDTNWKIAAVGRFDAPGEGASSCGATTSPARCTCSGSRTRTEPSRSGARSCT